MTSIHTSSLTPTISPGWAVWRRARRKEGSSARPRLNARCTPCTGRGRTTCWTASGTLLLAHRVPQPSQRTAGAGSRRDSRSSGRHLVVGDQALAHHQPVAERAARASTRPVACASAGIAPCLQKGSPGTSACTHASMAGSTRATRARAHHPGEHLPRPAPGRHQRMAVDHLPGERAALEGLAAEPRRLAPRRRHPCRRAFRATLEGMQRGAVGSQAWRPSSRIAAGSNASTAALPARHSPAVNSGASSSR